MREDDIKYALSRQLPSIVDAEKITINTGFGELELRGSAAVSAAKSIKKILTDELTCYEHNNEH